jgi:hypothetical protein
VRVSAEMPAGRYAPTQRGYHYARCAVVLDEDPEVPGAEALFDQALSNGLAAIVSTEWPGEELEKNGQVKSAARLLTVVTDHLESDSDGHYRLALEDGARVAVGDPDAESHLIIDVETLREAVTTGQAIRHGRRGILGALERRHIDALVALDRHPSLARFWEEYADRALARERARDLRLQAHAADYVELIGDDEVRRRVATAPDYLPIRPKDRIDGPSLYSCPVCTNDTLLGTAIDDLGYGIVVGICLVCSYSRGSVIADDEARELEWPRWRDS